MAVARDEDQQPADQEADRQAAGIAEKQPGGRSIERSKAQHRADERQRHGDAGTRQAADGSDDREAERDRHSLGDRHPINSIHEIDQVDEPQEPDQNEPALDPP